MADYDVAKIGELEGFYKGLFLKARSALGVKSFGGKRSLSTPRSW